VCGGEHKAAARIGRQLWQKAFLGRLAQTERGKNAPRRGSLISVAARTNEPGMKLYYHPISVNSRRAWATVLHLELTNKVELVKVEVLKGDNQKPEFAALNPNKKVPVLVDGDFKLWESAAVAIYLCENAPHQKLWPATSRGRADALRWISWHLAHFGPAVGTFNSENAFKPVMNRPADPAALERAEKDFHNFAPVINSHLEDRKFLLGDELSIADFYVGAGLGFEPTSKLPLDKYPHLRAWNQRLLGIPAWATTTPKFGG
jgi:glutathione S-transferase